MKTTPQQRKVIDACITELKSWIDTDDINSPNNFFEINSTFDAMEYHGIIDELHASKLKSIMSKLLTQIIILNKK